MLPTVPLKMVPANYPYSMSRRSSSLSTCRPDFVAGQVANNVLILALANGRILRIDLDNAEDVDGKSPRRWEIVY